MKMEQKPKRAGGADVINFAERKTELHKEAVFAEAQKKIQTLTDHLLNSASEASQYGDPRTHSALEALKIAHKKCMEENAEPGTDSFAILEQTLVSVKNQENVIREALEILDTFRDMLRTTESDEDKQAVQWGYDLLNNAYEKSGGYDGTYNLDASRNLEKVVTYLHSLIFQPSEENPPSVVMSFNKKA